MKEVLLFPFYKWGKLGFERLYTVTQGHTVSKSYSQLNRLYDMTFPSWKAAMRSGAFHVLSVQCFPGLGLTFGGDNAFPVFFSH